MDVTKLKFNDLQKMSRKHGLKGVHSASKMREFLLSIQKKVNNIFSAPSKIKDIKNSNHKKHYKMFLMFKAGFPNKEIAKNLDTNVGHVWNELKRYENTDREKLYLSKIK